MLIEAQLSGVPAPQQRMKAPNLDKGGQCVPFPGHAVTQALPRSGGCQQHNPGKQGLHLLNHALKSYKCGFATLIHPLMQHLHACRPHHLCLQLQQYRQVCKYRPYKMLCAKGPGDTAEYISKYSPERRDSRSLFPLQKIREKRSCPRLQITVKLKYEFWAFQGCAFAPRCLLFTVQRWLKNNTFHPQSLWSYHCLSLWKTGIKDRGTDRKMRN